MRRWVSAKRVDHVQHLLSDYIDGCLSARTTRAVEAHLLLCPACARELEEWRSLLQLVSRHAAVHCPIDCADVVLQRLSEGRGRRAEGRGSTALCPLPSALRPLSFALRSLLSALRPLPASPVLWAAMAVLLVALFGGWTWRQGLGPPQPTTAIARPGATALQPARPPALQGDAPARLDGAFGRSDSLILASDLAAEE